MNQATAEENTNTLFQRIGGAAVVNAAVLKLYDRILSDPEIKDFFKGLNIDHLRRSQEAFLIMSFGGPHQYTGQSLTAIHIKMVKDKGLNDRHFDRVVFHLKEALMELRVNPEIIDEVLMLVASMRDDVLDRKKPIG